MNKIVVILFFYLTTSLAQAMPLHQLVKIEGGLEHGIYYGAIVLKMDEGVTIESELQDLQINLLNNTHQINLFKPEPVFKKFEITKDFSIRKYVYENRALIPFSVSNPTGNLKIEIDYKVCSGDLCVPVNKILKFDSKINSATKIKYLKSKIAEYNQNTFIKFLDKRMIIMLLIGLLGGFTLNLMPCVLPILSIKFISLKNLLGSSKTTIRLQILATILGIMTFFISLALIITLVHTSFNRTLNWGFYFQNPYFTASIIIVLSVFIFQSLGYLSLMTPSYKLSHGIGKVLNYLDKNKSFYTNFASGFFSVVLATPCIAPIIGTAISFAFRSNNTFTFIAIFSSIGLGMCLPYIIFLCFPNVIRTLSKLSYLGKIFKEMNNAFLVLTLVWLLWILGSQAGYFVAVWLFGVIMFIKIIARKRFKIGERFKPRELYAIIIFMLGTFAIIYQTQTQTRQINALKNSTWVSFDEKLIASHLENGQSVFVDITAEWCFSCKTNKFLALETKEVLEFLKDNNIVAMQGDITLNNPQITKYLQKNGVYGIPFNIIYTPKNPEGIILPTLLTKTILIETLQKNLEPIRQ
jgi:suppressor for copper-sensitivity B